MEKTLHELTIDPEFRNLIPPLDGETRNALRDDIIAHSCLHPVAVWHNKIVDGHNRYDICWENNIPFYIVEMDFKDRDEAIAWIIMNQFSRRNLDDYSKGVLVLQYEEKLKVNARKRMSAANREGVPMLAHQRTRDVLAKMAGVSHGTLAKIKAIHEQADEETEGLIRSGKLSINKAYKELKPTIEGEKKKKADDHFDPVEDLAQIDEPVIINEEEDSTRPSDFADVVEQFGYIHQDYIMNIKASLKWIGKENAGPKALIAELLKHSYEEASALLDAHYATIEGGQG